MFVTVVAWTKQRRPLVEKRCLARTINCHWLLPRPRPRSVKLSELRFLKKVQLNWREFESRSQHKILATPSVGQNIVISALGKIVAVPVPDCQVLILAPIAIHSFIHSFIQSFILGRFRVRQVQPWHLLHVRHRRIPERDERHPLHDLPGLQLDLRRDLRCHFGGSGFLNCNPASHSVRQVRMVLSGNSNNLSHGNWMVYSS